MCFHVYKSFFNKSNKNTIYIQDDKVKYEVYIYGKKKEKIVIRNIHVPFLEWIVSSCCQIPLKGRHPFVPAD